MRHRMRLCLSPGSRWQIGCPKLASYHHKPFAVILKLLINNFAYWMPLQRGVGLTQVKSGPI